MIINPLCSDKSVIEKASEHKFFQIAGASMQKTAFLHDRHATACIEYAVQSNNDLSRLRLLYMPKN